MNFRRGRTREDPDINLIPLIDILIVILIFLFLTTTYSRFAELQINLPEASADRAQDRPQMLSVAVDSQGRTIWIVDAHRGKIRGPRAAVFSVIGPQPLAFRKRWLT